MTNLNLFFKSLEIPGVTIQLATDYKTVQKCVSHGEDYNYDSYLNDKEDQNLCFLAGVTEGMTTRATDKDIKFRKHISFDFDLRSEEDYCSDAELDQKIETILNAVKNSERFKDYFAAVNSANGLHLHYVGNLIDLSDKKNIFSLAMLELISEISKVAGFTADTACSNAGRLMRIPTSFNNKPWKDGSIKRIQSKFIEFHPETKTTLLDELMNIGEQVFREQRVLAKSQAYGAPSGITKESMDTYATINQIPISELVCSIFSWELDGEYHFRDPGLTKRKACYIPEGENYILHGGTEHFSDKQKGYNCFQFVKVHFELSNKETFDWFRERYPHIREIVNRDEPQESKEPNEPKAMQLVNLVQKNRIKLFSDQFNEPWASINGDGTKIMPIDSKIFGNLLFGLSHENGSTPGSETVKTAKAILGYQALKDGNNRRELFVRTAKQDDDLWYDLGEQAVKINKGGWSVVNPPIIFKRFQHQNNQILPEGGGNIFDFIDTVNVEKETDKILLAIFLVSCFIPGFPHPVLMLYGRQGSSKSCTFRMLKELVDPSSLSTLSLPRDTNQFIQTVSHHWMSLFDNCSRIPNDLSDAICRTVTGEGNVKRKLYTDDDEIIYNFQHVVGLNGIGSVASRPDLLDRSLLIEMAVIDESNRKDESILKMRFEESRPRVLGACFDAVSKAMAIRDKVDISWLPRMADFTKWGFAIAEAIGVGGDKFIDAYKINIDQQVEEVINADILCSAVIALVDKGDFEDTPTKMMEYVNEAATQLGYDIDHEKTWPLTVSYFMKRLLEIAPSMEKIGIEIDNGKSGGNRIVKIAKKQAKNNSTLDAKDTMDSISPDSEDYVQEVLDMF